MKLKLLAVLLYAMPSLALGFCGFYVGGATSKLYNNATQVVLMRHGTRTVLSMQNNYQGPPDSFAMIVPVPVILQKENVKILPKEIFDRVDIMGAPRLVEYWERNPCGPGIDDNGTIGLGVGGGGGNGSGIGRGAGFGGYAVTIEAQFTVGEYEIVILSARDSTGLDAWLRDNQYSIPEGAEPFLKPYVEQGSKFFVAKVDAKKVTFNDDGQAMLSPLRFHYDSEVFSLPVRLGLINSSGKQDLLVNILATQRYQTTNYQNVFIPTNLNVAESAKEQFGDFYAALFDDTIEKNPKSVVTEYSWSAATCDPCPGPTLTDNDVYTLGADVLPNGGMPRICEGDFGISGGPEVTEGKATIVGEGLDKDVIRRVIRRSIPGIKFCYKKELLNQPSLGGKVKIRFTIGGKGSVLSSAVEPGSFDQVVSQCVAKKIASLSFPAPKGGKDVEVVYPFLLQSLGVLDTPKVGGRCSIPASAFTLTRLHARYSADALGEDLIFESAGPVVGGRERYTDKGELEQGAEPSQDESDNFQARYIIRHAWQGEITCQKPTRGVWGGPPGGAAFVKPARDLAFAKRGQINLQQMLSPQASKPTSEQAKRLHEKSLSPSLPSYQTSVANFSPSWGFWLAAAGGLLLLLLVFASRARTK